MLSSAFCLPGHAGYGEKQQVSFLGWKRPLVIFIQPGQIRLIKWEDLPDVFVSTSILSKAYMSIMSKAAYAVNHKGTSLSIADHQLDPSNPLSYLTLFSFKGFLCPNFSIFFVINFFWLWCHEISEMKKFFQHLIHISISDGRSMLEVPLLFASF